MVTKNYDVIIVGTGAGGGTLAHTRGAWDLRHHAMPVRQHLHERGAKSIRQTLTVQKYTPVPLLMVIALIQFGNPSSGGANGVPFLPAFWRDIGPYLPPRNAYLLLHHTIYFHGHGTAQALTVLLIYLGAGAVILGLLDRYSTEAKVPADAAEAAAVAVPIGATP